MPSGNTDAEGEEEVGCPTCKENFSMADIGSHYEACVVADLKAAANRDRDVTWLNDERDIRSFTSDYLVLAISFYRDGLKSGP